MELQIANILRISLGDESHFVRAAMPRLPSFFVLKRISAEWYGITLHFQIGRRL